MGRPTAIAAATRLIRGLHEAGITSALPEGDADCLPPDLAAAVVPLEPPDEVSPDMELMVVLGGDGSILRGTEWVLAGRRPPARGQPRSRRLPRRGGVVGDRQHRRPRIVQRTYTVEERSTIEVALRDCASGEVVWSSYAVNEVSVEKASRERTLEVLVEVDGRPLSRWACDGVLLSTPTGSTAYAFSAGGPVIWPNVDALLVVPLSAHALFARPLVLGPDVARRHPADRALADRRRGVVRRATFRGPAGRPADRGPAGPPPAAPGPAVRGARSPTGWSTSSACGSRAGAARPRTARPARTVPSRSAPARTRTTPRTTTPLAPRGAAG